MLAQGEELGSNILRVGRRNSTNFSVEERMTEGEELGSNILQVFYRSRAYRIALRRLNQPADPQ
jgi:hypothetical protein